MQICITEFLVGYSSMRLYFAGDQISLIIRDQVGRLLAPSAQELIRFAVLYLTFGPAVGPYNPF